MAKGKKVCSCGNVVGVRTLDCKSCGHVFGLKKVKAETVVTEIVAKEVEKSVETLTS